MFKANLPKKKLIIGLGNPGLEYRNTRHNVGFSIIDILLADSSPIKAHICKEYELYKYAMAGDFYYLLKPLTYMNLSGNILPSIWRKIGSDIASTLVLCDNLDLAVGTLRFKEKGSSAGQKGLQSIIQVAGTQEFARLFIGIGRPAHAQQSIANYVLSHFVDGENEQLQRAYATAIKIIPLWLAAEYRSIYQEITLHAQSLS
jgi:peptidyl-tRNA hydrolase, PTH1 family